MGLGKFNDVVKLLDGDTQLVTENSDPSSDHQGVPQSADYGALKIQHTLFQSRVSVDDWPYDVLETLRQD